MDIDATTLSDLEVFGAADGTEGVFDLIDGTTTARGRAALRRRTLEPSSDRAQIEAVQASVRFLARHPGAVVLEPARQQAVDRYLESNIQLSTASTWRTPLESAWISVRYRAIRNELREGTSQTEALFARVGSLARSLGRRGPPEPLAAMLEEILEIATGVLAAYRDAPNLVALDRALRLEWRSPIERALELLGELDALQAMAGATRRRGWVLPEAIDSDDFLLEVEGIYHPFVEHPVANPVQLNGGEPMVFLTGPNMAGKTTYLRSAALAVLLAQMGMGVPAERMRWTPVDVLFTSLNPSDNLKAGLSYFLAEVLRVKEAATVLAEGRRALVLFDEVFKGTNVKDALEASAEVILGFSRARTSGFIFASHLAELVDELQSAPTIRFCRFEGEIVSGVARYSYTLREGVSDQRFGLLLLRQARVPELIDRIGA